MTRPAATLALICLACGPRPSVDDGGGGSSTSDSGLPDDAEVLVIEFAEVVCTRKEQCACEGTDETGEVCRKYWVQELQHFLDEVNDGVTEFHRECLVARIDAVRALGCDETEVEPLGWEQRACPIFVPREDDGNCGTPRLGRWWCTAGKWCRVVGGQVIEPGPGECVDEPTPGSAGERCPIYGSAYQPLCGEGLYCTGSDCVSGPPIGDPCPAPGLPYPGCQGGYCACGGDTCQLDEEVGAGLCVPFKEPGEPCFWDFECELSCLLTSGTCAEFPRLICSDWLEFF